MVSLTSLWLPILLAAIAVFVASSVIHMALKYHNSEFWQLPDEASILDRMRTAGVVPGFYSFPWAGSMKEYGSPEMLKKCEDGPIGTLNVVPSGPSAMGKALILWLIYSVVIGVFAAYLAGRTLPAGAHYLQVFRIVGCSSFMAYSFAHLSDAIWKQKPFSMCLKHVFDGLVYALLTAGVFGWLWPPNLP